MNKIIQNIVEYIIKIFKTSLITFAIVYIAFCTILYFNQESLLYHPPADNFDNCTTFEKNETHKIQSARFYSNINFDTSSDNLTTLVYFHGNAESACEQSIWKEISSKNNMNFLIVEYPGFSANSNHTSKENILSNTDVVAQLLNNKPHIIIGRSIGNGPATYLASKSNPKKVVLISPYDKLENIVWSKYIPGFLLKDNFEPIIYLQKYSGPVYVFAGENDITILPKFSRRINATKFTLVTGADHNSIFTDDFQNIIATIMN